MERLCIRLSEVKPGVIVMYTLRSSQLPCHPEKQWQGKVLCSDQLFRRVLVESLEEGYEGCEDDVWFEQIIRIEKPTDYDNGG